MRARTGWHWLGGVAKSERCPAMVIQHASCSGRSAHSGNPAASPTAQPYAQGRHQWPWAPRRWPPPRRPPLPRRHLLLPAAQHFNGGMPNLLARRLVALPRHNDSAAGCPTARHLCNPTLACLVGIGVRHRLVRCCGRCGRGRVLLNLRRQRNSTAGWVSGLNIARVGSLPPLRHV